MRSLTPEFPVLIVCTSACLLVVGLWAVCGRPRRRVGGEPRCHACDYLLAGIASERCPECGTVIDPKQLPRGQRRPRAARVLLGSLLILFGLSLPWRPLGEWWRSIYWYPFRSTASVMLDLKNGTGRPPPPNNPFGDGYRLSRWGMWPRADLAQVALDELQRRDRVGKLSPANRRALDELALRFVGTPIAGAVQPELEDEVCDRVYAGKFPEDLQAKLIAQSAVVSLTVPPLVAGGSEVPAAIKFATLMPNGRRMSFELEATLESIRIDGRNADFAKGDRSGFPVLLCGSRSVSLQKLLARQPAGPHRLEVVLQLDLFCGAASAPFYGMPVHGEAKTLEESFTVGELGATAPN